MNAPGRFCSLSLVLLLAACGNDRGLSNGNNNDNSDIDPFEFDDSDAHDVQEDRDWDVQGGQDVGPDPDVIVKPDADVEPDPDARTQDASEDADVPEGDADVPEGDADVPEGDADVPEGDADVPEGDADVPEGDADVPEGDADVPEGDADVGPDVPPGPECAIIFAEGDTDLFGSSVALNRAGDRLAVGAESNADGGERAGHVRVFERSGTEWTQLGGDIDGTEGAGAGFSVDINAAGDRVVVGSPFIDGRAGEARVFRFAGGAWEQMGTTIPGLGERSVVGQSVAINASGDRVAIGIWGNTFADAGAQVYEWRDGDWVVLGDPVQTADWGAMTSWSLSMNAAGDRVSMGSITGAEEYGRAEVFEWIDTEWVSMGGVLESGRGEIDQHGHCTSLNAAGDRLVVGARYDGTAFTRAGALRVYEWSEGAWTQVGDTILGSLEFGQLGQSCGIDDAGNRVAGGQPFRPGLVQTYQWVGGEWETLGEPMTQDDLNGSLGHSAAISGDGAYVVGGGPLTPGPSFAKVCDRPPLAGLGDACRADEECASSFCADIVLVEGELVGTCSEIAEGETCDTAIPLTEGSDIPIGLASVDDHTTYGGYCVSDGAPETWAGPERVYSMVVPARTEGRAEFITIRPQRLGLFLECPIDTNECQSLSGRSAAYANYSDDDVTVYITYDALDEDGGSPTVDVRFTPIDTWPGDDFCGNLTLPMDLTTPGGGGSGVGGIGTERGNHNPVYWNPDGVSCGAEPIIARGADGFRPMDIPDGVTARVEFTELNDGGVVFLIDGTCDASVGCLGMLDGPGVMEVTNTTGATQRWYLAIDSLITDGVPRFRYSAGRAP